MKRAFLVSLVLVILLATSCAQKPNPSESQCNDAICAKFELLSVGNSFDEVTTYRLSIEALTDLDEAEVFQSASLSGNLRSLLAPTSVEPSKDMKEIFATLPLVKGQVYIFESELALSPPTERSPYCAYSILIVIYQAEIGSLTLNPRIYTDGNGRVIDEYAFETLVATNVYPNMTPEHTYTPLPTKTRRPTITPANTATPTPLPYPIGDPRNSIATNYP